MEFGIIGDAANILEVEGSKKTPTGLPNFYYKKNWLHITGVCKRPANTKTPELSKEVFTMVLLLRR